MAQTNLVKTVQLQQSQIISVAQFIRDERETALRELLKPRIFMPIEVSVAPYDIQLSIEQNKLVFSLSDNNGQELEPVRLSLSFLRSTIRDYFMIVESYEKSKMMGGGKIEAIDMARRAIHNEAAEMLLKRLKAKIQIDHDTARSFFTLICVLHIGKVRSPRF